MRKLLIGIATIALAAPLFACGSTDHKAREAEQAVANADALVDENAAMDANVAVDANAVDANAAMNAEDVNVEATPQGSTDH
jgi:hypothetical protein